MHAYAHQWSCQLVYNPRIRLGFGLSDGEGTERLWSRMRKLIGITRSSAVCIPDPEHEMTTNSSTPEIPQNLDP